MEIEPWNESEWETNFQKIPQFVKEGEMGVCVNIFEQLNFSGANSTLTHNLFSAVCPNYKVTRNLHMAVRQLHDLPTFSEIAKEWPMSWNKFYETNNAFYYTALYFNITLQNAPKGKVKECVEYVEIFNKLPWTEEYNRLLGLLQ